MSAASDLLAGLVAEPWGQVSPSVYETGRLVSLAPWLLGHDRRVAFLLAAQRPDGRWGAPDEGYALVPTLSAVEALLSVLRHRGRGAPVPLPAVVLAAGRGLRLLRRWSETLHTRSLPDMPAIELIVPRLVAQANEHLDRVTTGTRDEPSLITSAHRLRCPAGMDESRPALIGGVLAAGAPVPTKLLHALEITGDAARQAPAVVPESTGTVGASPAATAAWLGTAEPPADDPARRHLEAVAGAGGGAVPCGIPITVFERAWVIGILLRAGIRVPVPPRLVAGLLGALGPGGTPAAAGLPADADTTAGTLYALGLLGRPQPPDVLWEYETPTHFCTWPGEDGFSVSTNAHVLEAFGHFLSARAQDHMDTARLTSRRRATVRKITNLLIEHQRPDGSWVDRWHASPYYATACCALALNAYGGAESAPAVQSAARWLTATQRADGSWGIWRGTVEETSYALQILLLSRPAEAGEYDRTVRRGYEYLRCAADDETALWHDKDLYFPRAIVRAGVLAALHLADQSG